MATNSGGWLYEPTGTPVDKATADNAQARVLEIKADASAAKSDAASALSTANSYAGQIAQANTTAGSALTTAQGAEATADNAADRVDALEVMGGVQPGSVNDAEMKLHAEQDGGLFNTALKAQIDESIALGTVTAPAGFSLPAPVPYSVYRMGLGQYGLDIDVQALRPSAGVTYYVHPDGHAGNNGLTEDSPIRYGDAVGMADVGTIVFLPGEYFRNTHTPPGIEKDLNLIGRPGAILTAFEHPNTLTWALEVGNIYKTTRSGTQSVVDKRDAYIDAAGDYPMYLKRDTLAGITGPGQWATSGGTVYVWAMGDANLATDASFLRLALETNTGPIRLRGGNTLYVQGLQIEGGGPTSGGLDARTFSTVPGTPRIIAVDTTVKYTPGKAFMVTSAEFALFIRCTAATTGGDGFSYHSTSEGVSNAIEVDCTTRNNGQGAGHTDNGSTTHGGARVIRVNGDYRGSYGPVLAEDSGGLSWNLGTVAGASRSPSRHWPYCASAYDAQMWLEDASHFGNTGKVALNAYGSGSAIHVRNTRAGSMMGASSTTSNGGTVDTY